MNDEPVTSSNASTATATPVNNNVSLLTSALDSAQEQHVESTSTTSNTTGVTSSATVSTPEPPSTPNNTAPNKRMSYSAHRISMYDLKPRFVIKFISACDIPPADFRSKCDPYIRAFISKHDDNEVDSEGRKVFRLKRISNFVYSPKRLDCKSAIWNCYRDFRIMPPEGSILTVELYHTTSDSTKPDNLLGKVDIPIASLNDETLKTFYLVNFKVSHLHISDIMKL